MIRVILTRLGSVHQNLRTDEVEGKTDVLPEVGKSFSMSAAPINENAFCRLVTTTPIQGIRHHTEEGSIEFWTENSHYGLQILDIDIEGAEVH